MNANTLFISFTNTPISKYEIWKQMIDFLKPNIENRNSFLVWNGNMLKESENLFKENMIHKRGPLFSVVLEENQEDSTFWSVVLKNSRFDFQLDFSKESDPMVQSVLIVSLIAGYMKQLEFCQLDQTGFTYQGELIADLTQTDFGSYFLLNDDVSKFQKLHDDLNAKKKEQMEKLALIYRTEKEKLMKRNPELSRENLASLTDSVCLRKDVKKILAQLVSLDEEEDPVGRSQYLHH